MTVSKHSVGSFLHQVTEHTGAHKAVYPGFCSVKRLEVFLLPLDGMLVHRRSLPRNLSGFPNNLPVPIFLYTWVERGAVRVKCLAQEHNTMSPARARTRTARSGVERTNHEATAPPHKVVQSNY